MATRTEGLFRWTNVRGLNRSMNPDALPDPLVPQIQDVELVPGAIGRRRPSLQSVTLTSGPTLTIRQLYIFITAAGVEELWAFSSTDGTTLAAHRYVSAAWNSVTLIDTPVGTAVSCATLNGKLFIAYNSSVNRLHLWDGSAVRRVGLSTPAAATVANTGAGAYAATARYYRVSMRIKSGSDIVVESELSDAVSFTPSGAGTAARVTKPTTVDSATHWVVWGLIGTSGDTYAIYHELSEIVVGTTTYDDSTNPSAYDGDAPFTLGLHIPPPSAEVLLSDGNRLLMAGAYESSAGAGETTPKQSRVWLTRVLGASDNGDDETIPNTVDQKNWVDCGEKDGDELYCLAGPIDGVVTAFKARSIYRLIPTGNDVVPYQIQKVTGTLGSSIPNATILAEDELGRPSIYFTTSGNVYRISPQGGLDLINQDLNPPATSSLTLSATAIVYWPERRQLLVIGPTYASGSYCFTPALSYRDEEGVMRGGWSFYKLNFSGSPTQTLSAAVYSPSLGPLVAGGSLPTASIGDLAFAGFGSTALKVYTETGLNTGLTRTDVDPAGSSCSGIVQLDSGQVGVSGVDSGAPNFYTFRGLTSDYQTEAGGYSSTAQRSIASNYSDKFYTIVETPAGTLKRLTLTTTGTLSATDTLETGWSSPSYAALGVSPDGASSYYCHFNTADAPIRKNNSTWVTAPSGGRVKANAILVLRSGDVLIGWSFASATGYVRHYSDAGALLYTYTLTGTNPGPVVLTPGIDDTSFWLSYARSDLSTYSGVTVAEIEIGTGTVLNTFNPENGTFDFDGPFCVMRATIVGTTAESKLGRFLTTGNTGNDMGGAITASVTSKPLIFGQQGRLNVSIDAPQVDAAVTTGATPTLALIRDYGTQTLSATVPALTAAGSETRVSVVAEGLMGADGRAWQLTYTWDSDQVSNDPTPAELTTAILVPYRLQEVRG